MSRAVVVLSLGRSGSSAVAGALHHAGVPMGLEAKFVPAHPDLNPKGHFEEHDFAFYDRELAKRVSQGMSIGGQPLTELGKNLRHRGRKWDLWGVKSTHMIWSFPYLRDVLPADVRLVVLHRRFGAVVASYRLHMNGAEGATTESAERTVNRNLAALHRTVEWATDPVLHVDWEDVVAQPYEQMERILAFAMPQPIEPWRIQKAADWIDPSLVHHA